MAARQNRQYEELGSTLAFRHGLGLGDLDLGIDWTPPTWYARSRASATVGGRPDSRRLAPWVGVSQSNLPHITDLRHGRYARCLGWPK